MSDNQGMIDKKDLERFEAAMNQFIVTAERLTAETKTAKQGNQNALPIVSIAVSLLIMILYIDMRREVATLEQYLSAIYMQAPHLKEN